MIIGPGARLGPYEVTALIGEGGMGRVWRAHHTGLKRDDALKVLPDEFAASPERLARFQREAQVLASLNHPNIAHVYGLEQSDGVQALVMELVEGPTLADRIAQGPIPIDEALPIAKQIAEALEAAHEQGIIHRDLKPANIKVRTDGTVKVLDFGLAKALDPASTAGATSHSPTITSPAMMTGAGVLLGTAAYVSPEQARGKTVDKRTDIWAFGCVLYEMLSGRRAFGGDEVSDVLASVLAREPDWTALPATTPPRVTAVLRRCLQKDRTQRARDMGDVALALEGAFETRIMGDESAGTTPAVTGWWIRATSVVIGVTVLLAGLVAGWALGIAGRADPITPVRRFQLAVPASIDFPPAGGTMVALSPDGQTVVYRGFDGAMPRLYQRRLDQLEATNIPGTEGAGPSPFFSPDSRSLAFTMGGRLMRVTLAGGSPTRIAEVTPPIVGVGGVGTGVRGGSWGFDDSIVVAVQQRGLIRVSATGGEVASLTTVDYGRQHWYPQILPSGRAVLYTDSEPYPDSGDLKVLDLDTKESRTVLRGGVAGHYTPTGHLVFLRGGDLWVVRFDPATLTVQGQPALVEQEIRVEPGGAIQFAVAQDGGLAYLSSIGDPTLRFVWVDRTGRETPVAAPPADYQEFALSPDGTRIAVRIGSVQGAVWVYDLVRNTSSRITFEADKVGATFPTWTPDGTRVAFGEPLSWKRADGIGAVERLDDAAVRAPQAFSADGKTLMFEDRSAGGGYGLGVLTLEDKSSATLVIDGPAAERNASLSPDGRWLAYSSNETGQRQVFVRPFPDVNSGRWQISTDGGDWPVWNPTGSELFYRGPTVVMMVGFRTEPTFSPGPPSKLFDRTFVGGLANRRMAVSRDGQRFLIFAPPQGATGDKARSQIIVVQGWFEELKRLVPVN